MPQETNTESPMSSAVELTNSIVHLIGMLRRTRNKSACITILANVMAALRQLDIDAYRAYFAAGMIDSEQYFAAGMIGSSEQSIRQRRSDDARTLHDEAQRSLLHAFLSRVDSLRNYHSIQGVSGNWDHDAYMHGMFNGLELALATMEGRTPDYRRRSHYGGTQEPPTVHENFVHSSARECANGVGSGS